MLLLMLWEDIITNNKSSHRASRLWDMECNNHNNNFNQELSKCPHSLLNQMLASTAFRTSRVTLLPITILCICNNNNNNSKGSLNISSNNSSNKPKCQTTKWTCLLAITWPLMLTKYSLHLNNNIHKWFNNSLNHLQQHMAIRWW